MRKRVRSTSAALLFLIGLATLTSAFNLPNRLRQVPAQQHATLTFADRVAYQRAIEEVYWRHRIWPKERRDPKPSLDAVMSQAQLEKKVAGYLGDLQALEDSWQKPITADQLQAEMDRMARDTKQPEVLRELFEALGNDPFVIAECLARPTLVERDFDIAESRTPSLEDSQAKVKTERRYASNADYTLPVILDGANGCMDNTWTATNTTGAPAPRTSHTAVWTGSEMIAWGGLNHGGLFNNGSRYNPSTDSWTPTNTTGAPAARWLHTAVWTGSEMIVWGGFDNNGTLLNTGGRYNPGTDSWTATSNTGAPTGRANHTAVWTGSEMIIWGGSDGSFSNTGGRYDPSTDSWTATSTTGAPTGRAYHTAVWTSSEMIIWGGSDGSYLNTGGRYDPSTDSWTATNTSGAPERRAVHTAVWTGSEMIVWGGSNAPHVAFLDGGRYDPSTDSWTATTTDNAPAGRFHHTAVWTGSEMIVWGGQNPRRGFGYFNTGGRYCAQTAPMAQSAFSRKTHGAAGTFDIPLPLTGNVGIECRTGGATNDYQMIINFATSVTMESASVTSGTGSVSSFSVSGSQVTVNLTGVTNVQVITVTLINVNDGTHVGNVPVSMGVLVGDVNGNGAVNASDVSLTKSQVGQEVSDSNFREDVNANGAISATDVALVKAEVGTALPP